MSGRIARKVGMSRIYTADGISVPVTYLEVEPNIVVRVKTKEKDGYDAIVLGIRPKQWKTRKGNEHTRYAHQKEWAVASLDGFEAGKTLNLEEFPTDTNITISAMSKGKGFQGVMRRHHFAGGPATHGSHFKREPGSVGMRTWPGRIHAGKKMPGHMGLETVTLKHRPVLVNDPAKKIIGIKGPIPGGNGSLVYLTPEPATAAKPTPKK